MVAYAKASLHFQPAGEHPKRLHKVACCPAQILLEQAEALGASHRANANSGGCALDRDYWPAQSQTGYPIQSISSISWDVSPSAGWRERRAHCSSLPCLACFCIWLNFRQHAAGSDSIFLINSLIRLIAFASISWVAAKVGADARDLNARSPLRTEHLEREVEEHKDQPDAYGKAPPAVPAIDREYHRRLWVTDPSETEVEYISRPSNGSGGNRVNRLYQAPSDG